MNDDNVVDIHSGRHRGSMDELLAEIKSRDVQFGIFLSEDHQGILVACASNGQPMSIAEMIYLLEAAKHKVLDRV